MTSVGAVLHNGRLVLPVVQLSSRHVLLEAVISLSAGFSYVCGIGFAGQVVGTCTGCVVDNTSLGVGFQLVFGFDKVFPERSASANLG